MYVRLPKWKGQKNGFYLCKLHNAKGKNNKKLGGILTETKVSADKVKHIIIGIGINTNQEKFNKNIEGIASSIKKEFNIDVDNKKVINKFCDLFQDKLIKRIGE